MIALTIACTILPFVVITFRKAILELLPLILMLGALIIAVSNVIDRMPPMDLWFAAQYDSAVYIFSAIVNLF